MTDTEPNGSRVPRTKTAELVAEKLRRRIAHGELVPGDRLPPEDELMKHFGIARTTLREGLRILESQGVLMVQRGRGGGPRVISPPIDRLAQALALHLQLQRTTVGDLDDARRLIEPWLAARLAERRTKGDLEALDEAIAAASDAAMRQDRKAFGEAATAVHETIVERGGNQTLATIARLLHELVGSYYRSAAGQSSPPEMNRAVRSYRKLYQLIEARDADAAYEHWRKQMIYTISRRDRDAPLDVFDAVEA